MCARDERTATENEGTDVLSSRKKAQKNLKGERWHPSPLYVRGFMILIYIL